MADEPKPAPSISSLEPAPPSKPDAAWVVPKHGRGRLMPPIKKGEIRNPNGSAGRYNEVVRMASTASVDVMKALIGIALDPSEDSRARIVACQEILGRAYGRIRAEVKTADGPATLDASKLSDRELEVLWKLAQAQGKE